MVQLVYLKTLLLKIMKSILMKMKKRKNLKKKMIKPLLENSLWILMILSKKNPNKKYMTRKLNFDEYLKFVFRSIFVLFLCI